jgi:hypothetical protein
MKHGLLIEHMYQDGFDYILSWCVHRSPKILLSTAKVIPLSVKMKKALWMTLVTTTLAGLANKWHRFGN